MIRQFSALRRTTPPAAEPVTTEELRRHARIAGEEADLAWLITTARERVEAASGRALINQTWTMTIDDWPSGDADWWETLHHLVHEDQVWLELPPSPLAAVPNVTVTTYDNADAPTVITVNDYWYVDTASEPGRLVLRSGESWPVDERPGAMGVITYVCGYGATGASVPAELRHAVLLLAAWMYEHRGDESAGDPLVLSGALACLAGRKVWTL